jgi:hypothetical protein
MRRRGTSDTIATISIYRGATPIGYSEDKGRLFVYHLRTDDTAAGVFFAHIYWVLAIRFEIFDSLFFLIDMAKLK